MDKLTIWSKHTPTKKDIGRAFCVYLLTALIIVAAAVLKLTLISHLASAMSPMSYVMFSFVIVLILLGHFLYAVLSRAELMCNLRMFTALYTALALGVISCIYLEILNPYLMPAMLASFVVATFAARRDTFTVNVFANVLVLFILLTQNHLSSDASYYVVVMKFVQGLASGTVVAYTISNSVKRLNFLWRGLLVAALSAVCVFGIVSVFDGKILTWVDIGYLVTGTLGQVILALVLQPIFETVFNLVTNTHLVELTDHNAPLIKRLKEEAPGTFNHSLAVANFAEICASAIGENPYLARACAFYHDVGKLNNPMFFKENQPDANPHDGLLPEVSAEIIRAHTADGKKLCDEYRIPPEISDVTIQHHGTLPIYIFFNKAKQLTDSEVDLADYSYHGFTPVTKIAAIIMLCDSGEAAIRAMDNPDPERVDNLLRKIISDRISAGQFDNCDITMHDLDIIRQTIIKAFGGQFHKRLKYPDGRQ